MKVYENYNLKNLNTFGISVNAKFFLEINTEEDLKELFTLKEYKENKILILGGGSNVLFVEDFDGLVILNKLKGIEIIKENEAYVYIKSMAGENWDELVNFTVNKNLWGIENLAFVPGSVGATPVQNIGAYGVEIRDSLEEVEAYNLNTGEKKNFKNEECKFGYRNSIFKNELKDKYFITAIVLKLNKMPVLNLEYKVLKDYIELNKIEIQQPKDISDAVTLIRKSKLPDPKVIGNAGSFFKNVVLSKIKDQDKIAKLLINYPDIPYFEELSDVDEDEILVKVPSGWLIEKCGPVNGTSWKGYRLGNVGVHSKQALVLVNHGGATGKEVYDLSLEIIKDVKDKFDLELVPEVNIIF
jgi:UDP-N-acetylmuramate dehydrogenase